MLLLISCMSTCQSCDLLIYATDVRTCLLNIDVLRYSVYMSGTVYVYVLVINVSDLLLHLPMFSVTLLCIRMCNTHVFIPTTILSVCLYLSVCVSVCLSIYMSRCVCAERQAVLFCPRRLVASLRSGSQC